MLKGVFVASVALLGGVSRASSDPLQPAINFLTGRVPGEEVPTGPLSAEELKPLIAEINTLQDFFSTHNKENPTAPVKVRRAFHSKGFCVKGRLEVLDSRPVFAQGGLFGSGAQGKSYPVWVRWSNGLGIVQGDFMPDVRGMAVKVFPDADKEAAYAAKFAQPGTDESPNGVTLDFLSTNGPTPTTQSAASLVKFGAAGAHDSGLVGNVKNAEFLATHPHTLKVFLDSILPPLRSYALTQYWSGSPYKVGSSTVKFNWAPDTKANGLKPNERPDGKLISLGGLVRRLEAARSVADATQVIKDAIKAVKGVTANLKDADYLRKDIQKRLGAGDLVFYLQMQDFVDQTKTPVEDLFKEWLEKDAPSKRVARLVLPKGSWDPSLQEACENAKFNPGNVLPGHAIAGSLNADRIHAYKASGNYRGEHNRPHDGL